MTLKDDPSILGDLREKGVMDRLIGRPKEQLLLVV